MRMGILRFLHLRRLRADILIAADVAGVDSYLINAACSRLKCKAVVKVYIRNERNINFLLDCGYRLGSFHIGNCDTDNIAACGLELLYLIYGCLDIVSLCVAH